MKKDPNAAAEADMEAAIMAQLDLDMEDLMKGGITDMIILEFYNSNVRNISLVTFKSTYKELSL